MEALTSEEFRKKHNQSPPESSVQRAILEIAQYHPAVAFAMRINAGAIKTEEGGLVKLAPAGTSDIIGMLKDGRFLAIEVKAGKNKPTLLQQMFIDDVNESGGMAFCAWSVDDVKKVLDGRD